MSTLASVFGYGVAASRPAAGIAGRHYYSTDTKVLERDNGSSWDTIATIGAPAGSTTQVQFNDAGALAGNAGLVFDKTTATLTATNGVFSTSLKVGSTNVSLAGHTHVAADVTDFGEAVDDRIATTLVAGTNITLTYNDAANTLTIAASGGGGGSPGGSSGQVQYNNAGAFAGSNLWQGTNLVEQRNSTNAQSFYLYNTYTDASNWERLGISWSANVLYFIADKLGTGTYRSMQFQVNGSTKMWIDATNGVQVNALGPTSGNDLILKGASVGSAWKISTSGHFLASADNTYDIGASAANRPRAGYFANTLQVASKDVGYLDIPQTTKTASYTLALADRGTHISITTGGIVVPANASVAFPIGTAITIYNDSGSSQTISITTDTMYLGGTATTGSRTLAQHGVATLLKVASTTWVIGGPGVT